MRQAVARTEVAPDEAARFDPPSPDAVRGLGPLFAAARFGDAASVSPEPRPWHTWPREMLRSALIGGVPQVMVGTVWAERQLRRLEADQPAAASLFRLLTMGAAVAGEEMRRVPADLLDRLRRSGIASEGQGVWTATYRVVPVEGLFLLADFPRLRPVLENSFVQLGSDSAVLAAMIEQEGRGGGRALDLCTGGGIQALALCRRYRQVDATDLNPRAIAMARANAALQGCEDALRLSVGDLYEGATGRYDLITANPPYMFFPDDVARTNLTGHGGALGIQVTLRILRGLDGRLADGGRAFIYTQGPRIDGRCQLVEETRRQLASAPLQIEFEEVLRGYWSPFRDFYRRMRVECLTSYRVRVTPAARFACTVRPLTGWRRVAIEAAVAVERRGWR